MRYLDQLQLDLCSAYLSFLRARHVASLLRYVKRKEPVEARIGQLRKKLELKDSRGMSFNGSEFSRRQEAAGPSASEMKEAAEVTAEDSVAEGEQETTTVTEPETVARPQLARHPEFSGEPMVFTDEQVSVLESLESEFDPGLIESANMAMKSLDSQFTVSLVRELDVPAHMGKIIRTHDAEHPQQLGYFIRAIELPEHVSMQISQGACRSLYQVRFLEMGNSMQERYVVLDSETKLILEKESQ